jgi:hypothetical protein
LFQSSSALIDCGQVQAGMMGCANDMSDPETTRMALVGLDELDEDAREQLARITLSAAREHAPEWLSDLAEHVAVEVGELMPTTYRVRS